MDAIVMLQRLSNALPVEAKMLQTWFVPKHPQEFGGFPGGDELAKMREQNLAVWDFTAIRPLITVGNIVNEANNGIDKADG
jgi:hypothetical protein